MLCLLLVRDLHASVAYRKKEVVFGLCMTQSIKQSCFSTIWWFDFLQEEKDWAADNNNKLSLFGTNLRYILSVCAEEQSNYKHYFEMCVRHDKMTMLSGH